VNEAREARGASDEQQQEAGREGIERARVADAFLAERPARDRDDVVRRNAGGLVDEEQAVSARGRALRAWA
jgi:hypothetical protein